MPFETIRTRLAARPFMPFCVVTSSGDRYAIRHPEMAVATKAELAIALPDADGTPLSPADPLDTPRDGTRAARCGTGSIGGPTGRRNFVYRKRPTRCGSGNYATLGS